MLAHGKEYKQVTIFERLIQLGKHVIIVLLSQNRNVTGAFGGIISTVISW